MQVKRMRRGLCVASVVVATAIARADAPVELDFFEYLGAMVEVDGEWIDPMAMQEQGEDGAQEVAAAERDTAADDETPAVVVDEQLEKIDEEG